MADKLVFSVNEKTLLREALEHLEALQGRRQKAMPEFAEVARQRIDLIRAVAVKVSAL